MPAIVYKFRSPAEEELCQCYFCGVDFSSPIIVQRKADGRIFYCPNGHGQSYTETEATRLKRELATAQQRLTWAQGERDAAQKEAKRLNLPIIYSRNSRHSFAGLNAVN